MSQKCLIVRMFSFHCDCVKSALGSIKEWVGSTRYPAESCNVTRPRSTIAPPSINRQLQESKAGVAVGVGDDVVHFGDLLPAPRSGRAQETLGEDLLVEDIAP